MALVTITGLAQKLKERGVDIEPSALKRWMLHNGFLMCTRPSGYLLPTPEPLNTGLMDLEVVGGSPKVLDNLSVLITPKGVDYFYLRLLEGKEAILGNEITDEEAKHEADRR